MCIRDRVWWRRATTRWRSAGGGRCPMRSARPRPRPTWTRSAPGPHPPPALPYPATVAVTRTVSAQALVAYRGNAYSVPPGLAGTTVQVAHRLGAATLDIAAGAVVLARHHREPDGAGAIVRDTGHVVALELEEHPADGGGGVHALVEDHQIDLALLENAGGLAEVSSGAPE